MGLVARRAERGDAGAAARLLLCGAAWPELAPSLDADERDEARVERLLAARLEGDALLKAVLCVSAEAADGSLAAFAAFDSAPQRLNGGRASSDECLDALRGAAALRGASSSNTLYLSCWGAAPGADNDALALVARSLFETLPECDFVLAFTGGADASRSSAAALLLETQGFVEVGSLAASGLAAGEGEGAEPESKWAPGEARLCAWALARNLVRPNLRARAAQVEDYDDLVAIFDSQSAVLSRVYGEYFLAELIESQDARNKACVADLDGTAVGLLCLSSEIDLAALRASYDLEPYDGLARASGSGGGGGDDNAFAVTLFCVDRTHASRARDLLEAAFASFPEREYCVLTLPCEAYEATLLPFFVSAPGRDGARLSHALYVLHRDALRALKAEPGGPPASSSSSPGWVGGSQLELGALREAGELATLLEGVEERDAVLRDVAEALASPHDVAALAVRVQGQAVGVVVVELPRGEAHDRQVAALDRLFDLRGVAGLAREGPLCFGLRHGVLRQVVLVPTFAQFARRVLGDAMRALELHAMHYRLFPGERIPRSVAEEMVQVRPRRLRYLQRQHRRNHLKEPRDRRSRHALFSLTKSALSEPRIVAQTRVVVVGASEAGLAAVEELLCVPHTCFAKLTLVAPGGVADERVPGVRELCSAGTAAAFDARVLDRLGLRERVTVVNDRVVYLEREAQAVVLAGGALLEYDYLVLATGLQDTSVASVLGISQRALQECRPLADSVYAVGGDPMAATTMRRMVQAKHAASKEQCLVYGASLEALAAVQALLQWGKPGKYVKLVHPLADEAALAHACFGGDEWAARAALAAIEQRGVKVISGLRLSGSERLPTGRIAKALFIKQQQQLLQPAAAAGAAEEKQGDAPLARLNGRVLTAAAGAAAREAQRELQASGARSLHGHVRAHVAGEEEKEPDAASLKLQSQQHSAKTGPAKAEPHSSSPDMLVEMACGLLITAAGKNVDPDVFASINDTGLVYDGRLVVDAEFRTVDPRIYGCGSLVKFARRLHAPLTVENYNSSEAGAAVAAALLRVADPLLAGADAEPHAALPGWTRPKVNAQQLVLPGGVRYVRASRPGWKDANARCKVLETNVPGAFCRLQVDHLGYLACVSVGVLDAYLEGDAAPKSDEGKDAEAKDKEELDLLVPPVEQLVGVHVSYLNDVERLLECGEIPDLLAFLAKPWSAALFHDRFWPFAQELRELVRGDENVTQVVDELRQVYAAAGGDGASESDFLDVAVKRNQLVGPGGSALKGRARQHMQERLARFLREHRSVMEQYHQAAV